MFSFAISGLEDFCSSRVSQRRGSLTRDEIDVVMKFMVHRRDRFPWSQRPTFAGGDSREEQGDGATKTLKSRVFF
jgi:hypothetical protein